MADRNHRNAVSRPSIYQTVTDRIIFRPQSWRNSVGETVEDAALRW